MSEGRLFADKSYRVEYPGSVWTVPDNVSVEKGRAIGKRFLIHGDMVDMKPEEDWVTVRVAQPELLPLWIRFFVP